MLLTHSFLIYKLSSFCGQPKLYADDGKKYLSDVINVKADYFKEFSKDIITAKTPWETKTKREGIALIFSMFLALLSLLKKHVS